MLVRYKKLICVLPGRCRVPQSRVPNQHPDQSVNQTRGTKLGRPGCQPSGRVYPIFIRACARPRMTVC